ncbi:MAG: TonB-dependent receptor [Pseudomonadota bacterium]
MKYPSRSSVAELRLMCTALALAVITFSNTSISQDTEKGAPDNAPPELETIVVVGEKIERSWKDTFGSVGIVTAEDFLDYDIYDTQTAYNRLANVRAFAQGSGSNSITIRGLNADGVTQPSNSAALISVVIDGVTQSNEALRRGSRGLWDVEQLEAHRGPQSTTQGRNALAGTVNIRSKNPTFDPEASVRFRYGNLDRGEAAVALSGPVIDEELAVRFSASYQEKTSDIRIVDPLNEPEREDEYYNIRAKALYQPQAMEGLEVLLSYNRTFDSPASSNVSGPDFFDRVFAADSLFTEAREIKNDNYSADISYKLSDQLILRSVTGFLDADLAVDSVPGSDYFRDDTRVDSDLTHEIRLELAEGESRLSGVAGLFYGSFEGDTDTFISFSGFTIQAGRVQNETESWALYADLRYRLSDTVSVLFGGRYLDDTVSQNAVAETLFGEEVTVQEADFQEFLPKLGIAVELTDNQNLALTASKGYRQGFAETRVGQEGIFDVAPEFLWSYEVAYRIVALNNRLQVGANAFFYDYTDQQIAVLDPNADPLPFTATLNAGESEAYGFEVEAQYQMRNGIHAFASLGYLETELGAFDDTNCPGGSCGGNSYSEAPEITGALGADYRHDSGIYGNFVITYTDEFFRNIENDEDLVVDDVFLVNVKAGYEFSNYRVGLFVNNLLDEDFLTAIFGSDLAVVGDGRAFGVELLANF